MSAESWVRSSAYLRGMSDDRYALANAVVLLNARRRWHSTVVARTSHSDLLFTLPGDEGQPFAQSVRAGVVDDGSYEVTWAGGRLHEERKTDLEHGDVDRERSASSAAARRGGRAVHPQRPEGRHPRSAKDRRGSHRD